jgi:hypothetical protein
MKLLRNLVSLQLLGLAESLGCISAAWLFLLSVNQR